jgi:hypothetical protein
MLFSFKLLSVTCNAVLSGEDSPWGNADGIRVFFFPLTGSQTHPVLISGSEFGPQDMTTCYKFVPGKTLELNNFPPTNFPSWETANFDVAETDFVELVVVGINEGLSYVAGGGGFGGGEAHLAGFEELSQQMNEEAAKNTANMQQIINDPVKLKEFLEAGKTASEVAGAVGISVGFKLLEDMIKELNKASDCRGVAFAFMVRQSFTRLFMDHMFKNTSTLVLNAATAMSPLHIASLSHFPSGCHTPNYQVTVEIRRKEELFLTASEKKLSSVPGAPREHNPEGNLCEPKEGGMRIWPVFYDYEFTLEPSFLKYRTLNQSWRIEEFLIPEHDDDTLTLTKSVEKPVEPGKPTELVKMEYRDITTGGKHQLKIKTFGKHGNYILKVRLEFQLTKNHPAVVFREENVFVFGQTIQGDEAYYKYLSCLEHIEGMMKKYVPVHRFIRPGSPIEEVIRFEGNVLSLRRLLTGAEEIPSAPMHPQHGDATSE